jgi:hypothetical protein
MLNYPIFMVWIVVTIGLRNSIESLHPVLKHALQGLFAVAAAISRIAADDSSCDGNTIPSRECLTCPKRKKSDGVRSGE